MTKQNDVLERLQRFHDSLNVNRHYMTAQTCREVQSDIAAAIASLDTVGEVERAARNLLPYARWTIGPESPGHHPTMPSAVAALEQALYEIDDTARTALQGDTPQGG